MPEPKLAACPSALTPWYGHVLRVRYQETDSMRVVFHGNYVTWFEVGRTEWIRSLGINYKDLETEGLLLPVTDLQVSYKQPAVYDDQVAVYTRLQDCSPIRMAFQSVVCRVQQSLADELSGNGWISEPTGELLVQGGTTHAWVNGDWHLTRFDRAQPDIWKLLQELKALPATSS
ncbi:acyl-CoA thioesterase [Paenibacillus taiwanensis]|uniref:acyl-CoA thioesterase n=1 Tax=Paenibacillus taiwanensis TaxID=401638 RepID=UPI0005652876|nr:acyl-CoA thioesterase [Paenibacillus taiwanensis]